MMAITMLIDLALTLIQIVHRKPRMARLPPLASSRRRSSPLIERLIRQPFLKEVQLLAILITALGTSGWSHASQIAYVMLQDSTGPRRHPKAWPCREASRSCLRQS